MIIVRKSGRAILGSNFLPTTEGKTGVISGIITAIIAITATIAVNN